MLIGIPSILSPDLLKALCEMGHGDRIVLADGNFPAKSMGKNAVVIRADGHGIPELLDAILKVFPLDTDVKHPVSLMQVPLGDKVKTSIRETYRHIIARHDNRDAGIIGEMERLAFYEAAKNAYCIVSTGETAIYGNIILQKGVVSPSHN